jgi:hypothetical protein
MVLEVFRKKRSRLGDGILKRFPRSGGAAGTGALPLPGFVVFVVLLGGVSKNEGNV